MSDRHILSLLNRRRFLTLAGVSAAWCSFGKLALAAAPTEQRFIFIMLRGAMDGLTAVPPLFDPAYAVARGKLAMGGVDAVCLPLDGQFSLHPALVNLHKLFAARQALVVHAIASPYRERSHFDAQDVLENGMDTAHAAQNGWLGRALAELQRVKGLAVGQNVPLALRGAADVTSWSPSVLPEPDHDLLQRLDDLYRNDLVLAPALHEAQAASSIADDAMTGGMDGKRGKNFAVLAKAAGNFLAAPDGPRLAMLEIGGWDTHAGQGTVKGRLAANLKHLDDGLGALQTALGAAWGQTTVLCATEFGRTVGANGTGGTDHGTGGAAFMLGGRVAGGRVIADWPGLAANQLYQGRDLRPTLDFRAVVKGVLAEQFDLAENVLSQRIFPDSGNARPLDGLLRR